MNIIYHVDVYNDNHKELHTQAITPDAAKDYMNNDSANITEAEIVTDTPMVSFEEAIPEYFRDATMMRAWNGLRDAGYLDESYKCVEGRATTTVCKFIVESFCQKRNKRIGRKDKVEWSPFEKFWGKSNLKSEKRECPKADAPIISKIFREI